MGTQLGLVEWFLACVAEDESEACLAEARRRDHLWVVTGADDAVGVDYDPARVLRECEAKRQIIAAALEVSPDSDWVDVDRLDGEHVQAYAGVMRELAAVYSDRPGYQQEWKP